MSLSITVRPGDATTGGDTHELPADGDNGNQKIDTKSEAEAALTFLKDDKSVVVVGDKVYKKEDLIGIRDRKDTPSPDAKTTTKRGDGVSIGVGVDGYYTAGLGDNGHSGGGAQLTARFGIPLFTSDGHLLALDILGGGDVGGFSAGEGQYTTPGGENVESSFIGGGALLGTMLRWQSPWMFGLGVGVQGVIGGFGSPDSTMVSLPTSCTPGDDSGFGRGECEPNAGPKTGNAGTTGLYNPDLGASRGTSGIMAKVEVPVVASVRVAEGEWGGLDLYGGGKFGYTHLAPNDGHGFGFGTVGGMLGVAGHFGGADAVVPSDPLTEDKDGDGVPGDGVEGGKDKCPGTLAGVEVNAEGCPIEEIEDKDKDGVGDKDDKCPDAAGTKENGGCPAYDAKVTSIPESLKAGDKLPLGLTLGAKSEVRIKFTDANNKSANTRTETIDSGDSTTEFDVPSTLPSGKYKVTITMKDPVTGAEKVEEKQIVIVERVTATLPGSFAPGQPPAVQDVKVVGLPKLEGVNYVIQAIDKKTGTVTGEASVADKPGTIQENTGTRIALQAPNGKNFQKDVNYVVTLKNKEGLALWTGSFEIGEAPPPPKQQGGGKGRRRA